MKKLLALAIAAAIASPMAIAANTPDNIGDVTYLGNIVANSPMWQWTVNDYPGGRLDVKPSAATTANGKTTYPLTASPFIAVNGYLPSLLSINEGSLNSNIGVVDVTTFTDGNGNPIADITDAKKGAVTFTITANSTNISGTPVTGKLTLTSTELRAVRVAGSSSINGQKSSFRTVLLASTTAFLPSAGSSCFSGVGSYTTTSNVVGGTAITPTVGEQSATAFNALLAALSSADDIGNAPKLSTLTGYTDNTAAAGNSSCVNGTASLSGGLVTGSQSIKIDYLSAAHIVELTPKNLVFNEPVSGAWNATLNVTAYQM